MSFRHIESFAKLLMMKRGTFAQRLAPRKCLLTIVGIMDCANLAVNITRRGTKKLKYCMPGAPQPARQPNSRQ